ncbi:MAG TPA: trypsin-like serine protease [Amycolatopsis sp.]|nr:trypsin-like serine protease [Amycolatopsis sp.]
MSRRRPTSRTARFAGLLAVTVTAGVLAAVPSSAISGGNPVADGTYGFAANINVGGVRGCTGALVAPQWVITARSCFADAGPLPAGPPPKPTTVTVGRTVLTGTGGSVQQVAEIDPRDDRDVVLAKLPTPVTGVTPVPIAANAPAAGEVLHVAGYGRTATDWVPDRLHAADFTVQAVRDDANLDVAASAGDSDPCKGDAGGPALRGTGGQVELAAISSTSWQHGCLDVTETRHGATETRLDTIASWIRDVTKGWGFIGGQELWRDSMWFDNAKHVSGDFNGDGKEDLAILYKWDNLHGVIHTWTSTDTGLKFNYAVWDSGPGQFAWDNAKFVAGDWNGDGKDDLAILYKWDNGRSVVHTWTSTGTAFTFHYVQWDSGPDQFIFENAKFVSGDWNGDGKTDLGILYKWQDTRSVIHTWTSTGTGLSFNYVVWDSASATANFDWSAVKLVTGDFTGDHKTDLAALYATDATHSAVQTWTSTGTGMDYDPQAIWRLTSGAPAQLVPGNAIPVAADLNGDQHRDLAFFYNHGADTAGILSFLNQNLGATTG